MSDEKKTPEESDDDGWGAAADGHTDPAADEANEDVSGVSPEHDSAEAEWVDPVNIEERVAALHSSAEQPATMPSDSVAASGPSDDGPGDDGPSDDGEEDDHSETRSSPDESTAEDDGRPSLAPVDDEDAPQWVAPPLATDPRTTATIAAPSSDMLAAAEAVAQRSSESRTNRTSPKDRAAARFGLTRKQLTRLVAGGVLLVLAGVVAILGWFNSRNYYLVCGTKSIRAEQGRFWPTGKTSLSGAAFRPISVPSDALCQGEAFETRDELEAAFLTALLAQSTKLLTSGGAEQVAVAEAQLQQALLLTRSPERSTERELAERLQGDVSYWRGAADVRRAVEALQLSATSFEGAATKRPRHSSDASAWAEHARYIAEEIDKGPRSLRADDAPKEEPHFGGLSGTAAPKPAVALENEQVPAREDSTTAPSEAMPTDAGVPTAPSSDADMPPIDAALPQGGVLL